MASSRSFFRARRGRSTPSPLGRWRRAPLHAPPILELVVQLHLHLTPKLIQRLDGIPLGGGRRRRAPLRAPARRRRREEKRAASGGGDAATGDGAFVVATDATPAATAAAAAAAARGDDRVASREVSVDARGVRRGVVAFFAARREPGVVFAIAVASADVLGTSASRARASSPPDRTRAPSSRAWASPPSSATGVATFFATGSSPSSRRGSPPSSQRGSSPSSRRKSPFRSRPRRLSPRGRAAATGRLAGTRAIRGPAPFRSRLGENRLAAAGADARRLGLPPPGEPPRYFAARHHRHVDVSLGELSHDEVQNLTLRRVLVSLRGEEPLALAAAFHPSASLEPNAPRVRELHARALLHLFDQIHLCLREELVVPPRPPRRRGESSSESATASSSPEEGFAAESSTVPRDLNADANVSTMPRANPPRLRRRAG